MAPDTSNLPVQSCGSYDLVEKIAEGGMGAIYKARHRESGQIVAIKIMPRHMASNPTLQRRFEMEFRAASQLDHPNIVRGLDFGNVNGMPYLVMEFVQGESLGARIERQGRIPVSDAVKLIVQVAQGLHRAHKQGLIHRDVKPDNILVTPEGTVKLADLGLVKTADADLNLTKTGRGLGTPHFMAPEQFRDAKNADARCDVYSLGATLYMMVTGELPFRSNGPLDAWLKKINNELVPPRQLMPDIPERCEWAILRALDPDKENRPSSCREFVEDLTGHSTRRLPTTVSSAPSNEIWYLVYKDDDGTTHTVKGTTSAIRRSLKEGLLGDATNVRAARNKAGPFEPLREFPEFRDLVMPVSQATPANLSSETAETRQRASSKKTAPGPAAPATAPVPHINLGGSASGPEDSSDWPLWGLLLILLAIGLGVVFTLFVLPNLR